MRLIPKSIDGQIEFLDTHLPRWEQDPAGVGLSVPEVEQLRAMLDEAVASKREADELRNLAKGATIILRDRMRRMNTGLAAAVKTIRAAAATDPSVYSNAVIAPPASGSKAPPPGKPTRFTATLAQVGWLTLTWECKNPAGTQGTMYEVSRRVALGEFEHLGVVGVKEFVDTTLSREGAARGVEYEVRAIRSTRVGPAARYVISFHSGAGSTMSQATAAA